MPNKRPGRQSQSALFISQVQRLYYTPSYVNFYSISYAFSLDHVCYIPLTHACIFATRLRLLNSGPCRLNPTRTGWDITSSNLLPLDRDY